MGNKEIIELLGDKAEYLLNHACTTIDQRMIIFPRQIILKKYG